jgi:transposase InsO family protein
LRKAHPTWGSKKILVTLDRERPDESWPARSTVDEILKRAGVVEPRGRRRRRQPSAPPVVEAAGPNDAWSMDYKGWFRVGDGTRCDPLTVNDVSSRASLVCLAMVSPKSGDVRRRLEEAFGAFGPRPARRSPSSWREQSFSHDPVPEAVRGYQGSSACGGALASAIAGGSVGSPRCARIRWIPSASKIAASSCRFMGPAHLAMPVGWKASRFRRSQ